MRERFCTEIHARTRTLFDVVYRRGQDRDVERNFAGQEGTRVGLARKHGRFERLQENVVERQSERNIRALVGVGHIGP